MLLRTTLLEPTKFFQTYFDFQIDFKSALELEFLLSCIRLSTPDSMRGGNRIVVVVDRRIECCTQLQCLPQ